MAEGALCLPPSIQLTFRSTKVEKATSMPFAPQGDLTIHGVTRNVELDVDSISPAVRMAASASTVDLE